MSKEFKVGLITLVAGAVLYWGFNFLKGTDFFSSTDKYYVIYENVDGLNKSNPVIINGLSIGRVTSIRLLQQDGNAIVVEFDVPDDISLGQGAKAALSNTDILGGKGITLSLGDLSNPLSPGDTLEPVVENMLDDLIQQASPVANNLNTTILRINEILIGLKGSGEKINATIGELQTLSGQINDVIATNDRNISSITAELAVLVPNINDRVTAFGVLMDKSGGIIDSLTQVNLSSTLSGVDTLLYTLNETIRYMKESEGTLGKLIREDTVYNNLNQLLLDLDRMVIHLDQYPKDFLKPLGRKHKNLERPDVD